MAQWSKYKKLVESNFADSVKGRVELQAASYKSGLQTIPDFPEPPD